MTVRTHHTWTWRICTLRIQYDVATDVALDNVLNQMYLCLTGIVAQTSELAPLFGIIESLALMNQVSRCCTKQNVLNYSIENETGLET